MFVILFRLNFKQKISRFFLILERQRSLIRNQQWCTWDNFNNRPSFNELEITAILLTAFYESKITQVGFKVFLNCARLITNFDLPKSYNTCASKLLKEFDKAIEYSKKWYCAVCKNFRNISQYQWNCELCLNR